MEIRRILCFSATAAMLFCVVEGERTQPPAKESEEMTSEPNSNAEFSGIAPYGAPNMLPPYMANSFGSYPYGSGYGLNNQYPVSPIRSPIATPSIYGQYNPFGQPPIPQNRYLPSPFGGAFNPYSGYPNQGLGFGFDFGCTPVSVQGDATYCVQGPGAKRWAIVVQTSQAIVGDTSAFSGHIRNALRSGLLGAAGCDYGADTINP
ncbi:unnamed protein product [Albugo candida]|uniref:Uncharacterized protein n=1 Tax=Albugo candida TaxID=65357 RepID=A0A024G3U1_9STRA|nr:unnamed protein product [Albugo candida]|eukprot:CCI41242.1 unnamed protein product [Albugo candida]